MAATAGDDLGISRPEPVEHGLPLQDHGQRAHVPQVTPDGTWAAVCRGAGGLSRRYSAICTTPKSVVAALR